MFVERLHSRTRIVRPALCFAAATFLIAAFTNIRQPRTVRANADRKAEGAELFTTSGCTHCHGDALQGTSKGPVLLNVRKKLTREQMHKQIAEGGASMPAFGDSINSDQIDALIDFLRDKHPENCLPSTPPVRLLHPGNNNLVATQMAARTVATDRTSETAAEA